MKSSFKKALKILAKRMINLNWAIIGKCFGGYQNESGFT